MLSHPVIELTPIRALMKRWLTLPGRVAEKVLFCWSSPPLFIVKVLLRASSRTKTSVSSECITHVIPARTSSMENHTCISLFVTEQLP